jgi:hypothetical protein
MRTKVPKIFTSIEELEIGEIGEYQGETNETFTRGYFYQRNEPVSVVYKQTQKSFPYTLYMDVIINRELYKRFYGLPQIDYTVEQITVWYANMETYTVAVLLFNSSLIVGANLHTFNFLNNEYVVYPYACILLRNSEGERYIDFDNPVDVISGRLVYKGLSLTLSGYQQGATIYPGIEIEESHRVVGWLRYLGYYIGFVMDSDLLQIAASKTLSEFEIADGIRDTPTVSSFITINEYSFIANDVISRIDTQPATDPTQFATAAQGAKADTALQSIAKGTDGNYITTTIGAKAGNSQTVSSSLTIQDLSSAGASAKGLAEASDVKEYIGNNTAKPEQGAKADSALQEINHGTDGQFVTTTVTQKANNAQTIYTSLTLQGIATADAQHQGVAEASDVRNYLNIIAAISEAYGVMWDTANPSPTLTRIGNMTNHALLPVQSQMIGGVMADDGTFTPFDNQSDWTQATQARDGSDGQVMVRLPKHWRRCSTFGTYNIVMLSPVAIPGYIEVREQYVSAYEATLQHSTSKLCSVNNADADYRGGQNEASWDGTYRTLLNRPVSNYNLTEFRTFARNRANNTKWNCLTYEAIRTIYWLFVTEYATLDSQADFNSALDANGFRQGGLGIGVTDWTGGAWNAFNGYAPLIPCGILDEYGSGTAVKQFSVYNSDTTLAHTFSCNKYRGIEMPFAHIWKYVDGVLVNVESGNGVSTVYATTDTSCFSSTSFANYAEICNSYRVDSYIKDIVFNKEGDIFAISPNGNSTSYYCDMYWGGNLPSATELRAWLFGGIAYLGAQCGLACSRSYHGVGARHRYFGSRLCYVP